MIEGTKNTAAPEGFQAPRRGAAARAGRPDFRALFRGAAPKAASQPQQPPQSQPAATPATAPAAFTYTLPSTPAGLPDMFSPAAFEARMNQWHMGLTQRLNDAAMENYRLVVDGWKNTNTRHRELGLPELPPPAPPQLASVEPMAPGWWFRTDL
jgi:hypothetical protein